MKLEGHVDRFDLFGIHGWAADHDDLDRTLRVQIVANDRIIGEVPAAVFRDDLLSCGVGDGRKAFWFNPFEHLQYGENRFQVFFSGTRSLLYGGAHTFYFDSHQLAKWGSADPMAASKTRWLGSEPDRSLTWGSIMTGDSFFDEVSKHVDLAGLGDKKILEVGPGYGRLLSTLLARSEPYGSYVGLDLSQDRVRQLTEKFSDSRTRFIAGDAMVDRVDTDCDLFLSSATFEHLYPNFIQTVFNIGRQLKTGADLCIDFVQIDPDMLVSSAWFESKETGGAFVRVYSKPEIEQLFGQCGLQVKSVASITAGQGFAGETIRRILVCARLAQSAASAVGAAQQAINPPLAIGTAESAEWHIPREDAATIKASPFTRLRSRAWRGLFALRHSPAVKPYVDRLARTRGYRLIKKLAAGSLLRNR